MNFEQISFPINLLKSYGQNLKLIQEVEIYYIYPTVSKGNYFKSSDFCAGFIMDYQEQRNANNVYTK
jgi:hypothetical protein